MTNFDWRQSSSRRPYVGSWSRSDGSPRRRGRNRVRTFDTLGSGIWRRRRSCRRRCSSRTSERRFHPRYYFLEPSCWLHWRAWPGFWRRWTPCRRIWWSCLSLNSDFSAWVHGLRPKDTAFSSCMTKKMKLEYFQRNLIWFVFEKFSFLFLVCFVLNEIEICAFSKLGTLTMKNVLGTWAYFSVIVHKL